MAVSVYYLANIGVSWDFKLRWNLLRIEICKWVFLAEIVID